MTTSSIAAGVPLAQSMARARVSARQLAGVSFFAAGVIVFMGIITAEALYPALYTTFRNEISDLGGTRPPAGLVFQPSATIFNASMLVGGLLITIGAVVTQRVFARWHVTLPTGILGVGVVFVALFPGPTGTPHALSAMVAFFAGGFAAVLSSSVVRSPFRIVLLLLGVVNLACLASYFALGDANPMWALGVGGAERWVAYPEILWLLGFGGYVAGSSELEHELEHQPASGTATDQPGT
jgi:hypothetical membrane protein